MGIISTTDFFMPIVDDPFTFGRIAATNAISDIYAMGGKPIMAIAILGWPINLLSAEVAQQVIDGGRSVCHEAGISLAGGHSIDSPEPIFGLAVTGSIELSKLNQIVSVGRSMKKVLKESNQSIFSEFKLYFHHTKNPHYILPYYGIF